ncbi:hypothetical protein V8F06_013011 [Rhypophila decipiens]
MQASAADPSAAAAAPSSASSSASISESGSSQAPAAASRAAVVPGQIALPGSAANETTAAVRRQANRSSRSSRKGHYSCDFCRVRKLRCDRPLPCTNCVSRGKKCSFVSGDGQVFEADRTPSQDRSQRVVRNGPPGTLDPSTTALPENGASLLHGLSASTNNVPPADAPPQGSLLAEIQALRRLAQDLENRVAQTSTPSNSHEVHPPCELTPTSARFDIGSTRAHLSSDIGEVGEVVAQLERVSMGQVSHAPAFVDALVFKTERIQVIPRIPVYSNQSPKPARCIVLPLQEEANVLVDKFINCVSYIYRVVHHPSLPAIVDDVYRQINGHEPIRPGHLVLLLSIIATATHVWGSGDGQTGSASLLFSSAAQANSQTPLWIKLTHDVLNAKQNCPTTSLETVQGVIILSFLLSNIEGVSLRYRALINTGLLLGREMGLHRIDHPSNLINAHTLEAEMGRRAWWYLVATDWLMAARVGGPGEGVYFSNPDHMMVKKPRNVNDLNLAITSYHQDPPLSQPTEMSYSIQRVRLAEISRRVVDHNAMIAYGPGRSQQDAHILAMDAEIDRMLRDIPAFFHLENYDHDLDEESTKTFIEAYLLNSLIHTVRCKLHLGYLSSGPDVNSQSHAFSRDACLGSARRLLRAEIQLMRTRHPFVETRLHLAGNLYGIFVASIVLLMDAYVTGSPLDETRRSEVNEALRIVENAKGHSLAATNLHESLTDVLAKHRARLELKQHQYHQQQELHQHLPQHSTYYQQQQALRIANPAGHHQQQQHEQLPISATPGAGAYGGPIMPGSGDANMAVPLSYEDGHHIGYDNELAQGLEALMEYDGFQWNDLLSGIDSRSFF